MNSWNSVYYIWVNKKDFPNPKLNLPKELRDSKDESKNKNFAAIDEYLSMVSPYLYTDIDLDNDPSGPIHIHAWILKLVSANVLRSLYIRNSLVDNVNSRNIVGFFLPLKAWFEVVGFLASILHLLESNLPQVEILEKLKPYALGNKGEGSLRVGIIDAKSVADMMQKADKYMQKMIEETKKNEPLKKERSENYFTDFYDIASNPSHPSFDAHELVGGLREGGVWSANTPEEFKNGLVEWLPGYGGLLITPLFVVNLCEKIFKIEKDHFSKVKCTKYFD